MGSANGMAADRRVCSLKLAPDTAIRKHAKQCRCNTLVTYTCGRRAAPSATHTGRPQVSSNHKHQHEHPSPLQPTLAGGVAARREGNERPVGLHRSHCRAARPRIQGTQLMHHRQQRSPKVWGQSRRVWKCVHFHICWWGGGGSAPRTRSAYSLLGALPHLYDCTPQKRQSPSTHTAVPIQTGTRCTAATTTNRSTVKDGASTGARARPRLTPPS